MNDRVHPSANKPAPAAKHPLPRSRSPHGRGGCSFCSCCLCLILLVVVITAGTGAVFYAFYRPHLPSFSIDTLQLSTFNLTDTSVTAAAFNFSLTARNPNKKIDFVYDRISVRFISGDVGMGEGSFSGFTHGRRNVTTLRTVVSSSNSPIPAGADLKSTSLPMKIELEMKMKAKAWKITTNKIRIRVTCQGIEISIHTAGKTATSNVKCKVEPRVKIIKWTV